MATNKAVLRRSIRKLDLHARTFQNRWMDLHEDLEVHIKDVGRKDQAKDIDKAGRELIKRIEMMMKEMEPPNEIDLASSPTAVPVTSAQSASDNGTGKEESVKTMEGSVEI